MNDEKKEKIKEAWGLAALLLMFIVLILFLEAACAAPKKSEQKIQAQLTGLTKDTTSYIAEQQKMNRLILNTLGQVVPQVGAIETKQNAQGAQLDDMRKPEHLRGRTYYRESNYVHNGSTVTRFSKDGKYGLEVRRGKETLTLWDFEPRSVK